MNLTLDEAMEEYISYSKLKLKPQSISKIYNRYENQIKPLLGNKFIDKIEPKDILDLEKNLFNKNFVPFLRALSFKKRIIYKNTLKFSFLWHFYQKWSGKQDFSRTTCKSL